MKKIGALVFIACFLMGFMAPINAQEAGATISISDKAEVSVENLKDMTSLKASFQIKSEALNTIDVIFSFNKDITNNTEIKIKQYRYNKNSGILTIYLSGQEALPSSLGTIEFKADKNVKNVLVDVLEEEFQAVNSTLGTETKVTANEEGTKIWLNGNQPETPDNGGNQSGDDSSDDVTKPGDEGTGDSRPDNGSGSGEGSGSDNGSGSGDGSGTGDGSGDDSNNQGQTDSKNTEGTNTSVQNGVNVFGSLMFSSLSCILFVFIMKVVKKAQ